MAYVYDYIFHPLSRFLFRTKGPFEIPRPVGLLVLADGGLISRV